MEPRPSPKQLEESIQRVQDAIARGQSTHVELLKTVLAAAGAHALDRVSAKLQQKLERDRLREERRRRRRAARSRASKPEAFTLAAAALVALGFAVAVPHLWWMVFVALGLGISAGRQFARAIQSDRELAAQQREEDALLAGETTPAPRPTQERFAPAPGKLAGESDPALGQIATRETRVDSTCERLLAELKSGPQAVRDFVQRPEETVKALRSACHELARRERELRSACPPEDEARLQGERAALATRVAQEKDEVARGRLAGALQALDGQLAQRAELATAASRFEAEGTRILYTLENLRAQVLRARSADAASADVVGAGLRMSLTQVTQEMDAVAEALEAVHRDDGFKPAPVAEVAGDGPTDLGPAGAKNRVR